MHCTYDIISVLVAELNFMCKISTHHLFNRLTFTDISEADMLHKNITLIFSLLYNNRKLIKVFIHTDRIQSLLRSISLLPDWRVDHLDSQEPKTLE